MKALFWVLGLFVLAVAVAVAAMVDSASLVSFFVPPYRVDISLNAFLLILLGVFPLIYALLRVLFITLSLPERVHVYRETRRRQLLMHDIIAAVIALFSGRLQKAEKAALRALESNPEPDLQLVGSLVAARAAHFMRNDSARDGYLARIDPSLNGDAQLALFVTQAHLANEQRNYTVALQALERVRAISPNLTAALLMEVSVRQRLGQADKVLALLEPLLKSEAISPNQAFRYRQQAYLQLLQDLHLDTREWMSWWQKVPAELRSDPLVAHAAANRFLRAGDAALARQCVIVAIEKQWDAHLLELFGQVELHRDADGHLQLLPAIEMAEQWLDKHLRDAGLLLVLARLCRAQQLWGKARSYAEASLGIRASAGAHLELAELAADHEEEEPGKHIREALRLAMDGRLVP